MRTTEDSSDISVLFAKKLPSILGIGLLCSGLGLLAASTIHQEKFRSEAKIMLQQLEVSEMVATIKGYPLFKSVTPRTNPINTQVEILKSRDFAGRVLARLKRNHQASLIPGVTEQLIVSSFKAENLIGTDIIELSVSWHEPKLAKMLADTYIAEYVQYQNDTVKEPLESQQEYLNSQIHLAERNLQALESDIKAYQLKNRVFDVPTEINLMVSRHQELDKKYGEVSRDRAALNSEIKSISRQLGLDVKTAINSVATGHNESLINLSQKLREAQEELNIKALKYSPGNPVISSLNEKVAVLQDQIQEETLKTLGIKNVSNTGVLINDMVRTNLVDRLASKSSDYLALSPVVSGFNTELRQIQHQLNDLPEKNLKLARMILEQNTQKDILTSLKKKYAELQIQSAQPANGFKIVESPDLPEQASFPNRWHLAVLIGIMGAGLSAFVLLGRQLADEFYYKEPKAIHNQPKKAKTESVSRQKNTEIAVEMMKYVKTSGIQSAVVAPVISTSGHSELTFNLGLTLAGIGHSVLLLDGDLCHPSLHHHCRLTPDYMTSLPALLDEMAEYGRHKPDATKLSELIDSYIHPFEQVSGLYTINSGIPLKETYAYLHSRHFRELIRLLKNQFDFILVNGPPLLGSEDSLALVETLQSMVLVADSQTPQDLISNIQERVIKTGGRLLGCILKDA